LLPLVALIAALNFDKFWHLFDTYGIFAAALIALLGVGAGWAIGGPDAQTRRLLALGTGLRNFSVALVVASSSFNDTSVEIMVIVATLVGLSITSFFAWLWGSRTPAIG
jgi:BASS family bile acid:Na+ symporter